MTNSPVIVYVGAFRFPDKDAAAKRVLGIGFLLRDIGYKVVFAGGENGETVLNHYEGFEYYSQNELDIPTNGVFDKIQKFLLMGNKTVAWLKKFTKQQRIEKVIIYNSSGVFINKIKKFCNKNNIEVLADITEWYNSEHLPGGKYGPIGIDNWYKMNYIYKTVPKHIVISTFLKKNYRNNLSYVVPPLILSKSIISKRKSEKIKRIIYVGSPGQKDNLELMVDTYLLKQEKLQNIEIIIAGISQEEYNAIYNKQLCVNNKITFLGRISKEEVKVLYESADFSFFLRPNERYANAGFPTKFVESLSYGIPIITTSTSDISYFLENGKNGYLLKNLSKQCLFKLLTKVNNLSDDECYYMKNESLKSSESFYYKNFSEGFKNFFN